MSGSGLIKRLFDPGDTIFDEGEIGKEAYYVEEGEVKITRHSGGVEIELGTAFSGDLIGEMALIDSKPRMASAVSVGSSRLIVIPHAAFERLKAEADPLILLVLNLMLKRLRIQSEKNSNAISY